MRALLVAMLCVASLAVAAEAAEDPPVQAPVEAEEVIVGRLEGGRRVPELDEITRLAVSADGERIAFVATSR